MKKSLITTGIALVMAIGTFTASAQSDPLNPCPDCPPCTNCPPYTNTFMPVEYPTNALLIRQIQIATGANVIYTGPNWILDTNNLLIASGGGWVGSPTDSNWTYTLGITNSLPNLLYSLEYRSSLGVPGTNVGNYFVGSTNGAELVMTNTVSSAGSAGFWLIHQQPGFIAWGHVAKKPQGMGIVENLQCPGIWSGYIDFTNGPVGGQYRIDTNYLSHSFTDFTRMTNAIEQWGGPYFGCNHGAMSVPNTNTLQAFTSWCRVFIMYQHDWPSNQDYPVWAQGFQSP